MSIRDTADSRPERPARVRRDAFSLYPVYGIRSTILSSRR